MSDIRLQNVVIGYHPLKPISQPINLHMEQGEIIAFIGRNGAGKSTLLKSISGQIKTLSGQILINGTEIHSLSLEQRSQLLSVVTTGNDRVTHFSVEESIALGRHCHTNFLGTLQQTDKEIIDETIQLLKIGHLRKKQMGELSDGERQRVALARALVQETPFLLLDEPTSHLDYPSRIELFQLLQSLSSEKHIGILISTHELDLTLRFCQRLWCYFPDGKVTSHLSTEITGDRLNTLYATTVF